MGLWPNTMNLYPTLCLTIEITHWTVPFRGFIDTCRISIASTWVSVVSLREREGFRGRESYKNSSGLRGEEDRMTEDKTEKMTWTVERVGQ